MFSVVKNDLGDLREHDFGQMESSFRALFQGTSTELRLTPNAQPFCVAEGIIKLVKAL